MLSKEEIIERINSEDPYYLDKAKVKGYICPKCKAGTRKKGTGMVLGEDKKHYKCFSCGFCGDNLSLIGEVFGLTDFNQILNKGCELYSITPNWHTDKKKPTILKVSEKNGMMGYFIEAHKRLGNTDYYRGISLTTLNNFMIGYDKCWSHPGIKNGKKTPRLIIPTSKYSYLARDTREHIPESEQSYAKMKVGKVHLFNVSALNGIDAVFVVEGEFDALSIIDCGYEAIALGSVSNVKKFLDEVKTRRPTKPLILSLDNDDSGKKATDELAEGLEELNIPYIIRNIAGECKDCNELLLSDRAALIEQLKVAEIDVGKLQDDERADYISKHCAANDIYGLFGANNTEYIPTGYKSLDVALDGGLYEGLYCIGAISSLGKSTFCLQIANQVAHNGTDVLIISLEMSRHQLVSKSLSMHTYLDCIKNNEDLSLAKTSRGISTRSKYVNYTENDRRIIARATNSYESYAERVFIFEGVGDITVDRIKDIIENHISYTDNKPVVIIDYLQIISPHNDRGTDKQNIDYNVVALKRISRDYKLPIIAISSFNRENYNKKVNLTSFKESGAIEYTADVIMGIQHQAANNNDYDYETENKRNPRQLEVVILKNREGETYQHLQFKYYPMYNFFDDSYPCCLLSDFENDSREIYELEDKIFFNSNKPDAQQNLIDEFEKIKKAEKNPSFIGDVDFLDDLEL